MKSRKKKALTGYIVCTYCNNLVPKNKKFNEWEGYKIRDGHVFCKKCSSEIK